MGCHSFKDKNGFPVHLCTGSAFPPGDKECTEAINSQGRACYKCEVDCYRKGWFKDAVGRDNKRFITRKNAERML